MTKQTVILAMTVAIVIATVLCLALKRFSTNRAQRSSLQPIQIATIAFALSAWLAFPLLLGFWQDLSRWIHPREAVEWTPSGLVVLAIPTLFGRSLRNSLRRTSIVLGCLICCGFAIRMLAGSVYLNSNNFGWRNLLGILGWGCLMAVVWLSIVIRDKKIESVSAPGHLQIALGLAVSANLGMSGSFTYAAIGLLITSVAATVGWLAAPSPLTPVASIALLGLGPTFIETSWPVTLGLALAILFVSLANCVSRFRVRLMLMLVALALGAMATTTTTLQFRQSIQSKSQESTGYEAYR